MKSLTVPAKTECIDEINDFVGQELEAYDCPMKVQMQIELAIEEIFVNIASYAYHPVEGEAEIRCDILQDQSLRPAGQGGRGHVRGGAGGARGRPRHFAGEKDDGRRQVRL